MKAFWGSVLLFTALLSFVLFNARYVHQSTDYLRFAAEQLTEPSQQKSALEELEAFWNAHRPWLATSIRHSELNDVSELIVSLKWAYDTQSTDDFERNRLLLRDAADELERSERLSFESIF